MLSREAHALQPVTMFIEAARAANTDNREAAALLEQRRAEADVASRRLYPSLDAKGTYTRNQYEVKIALPAAGGGSSAPLTVQPTNQVDGSFKVSIPVIDVATWEKAKASRFTASSSEASRVAKQLTIEKEVSRAYWQLVGSEALLVAASKSGAAAREDVVLAKDRREVGTGSELDLQRAIARAAETDQDVSDADLQVVQNRRSLRTLSGLEPDPSSVFPTDDLHPELPLGTFLGSDEGLPSVQEALASRRSAEKSADAARSAWLPTASVAGEERLTNATSFSGRANYYLLTATLAWHLDPTIPATVRAQNAAASAARAREDAARHSAEDAIFDAWHQVRANIEKARSARAQLGASELAASSARDRFVLGVATQLDLLQAERDAFKADANRVQADADLAYARAALRISAARTRDVKESR